jgi:hypothetical protein
METPRGEASRSAQHGIDGMIWKSLVPVAGFAAFVEAVGLVVLPSFDPAIQDIFVWFLMLFPILVVAMLLAAQLFRPVFTSPRPQDSEYRRSAEQLSPGGEIRALQDGGSDIIEIPTQEEARVRTP